MKSKHQNDNNSIFEYIDFVYDEEQELKEDLLLEMANIIGKYVKTDNIDFSLYFSRKSASRHAIRVKVYWGRERLNDDMCGYIELHGNFSYSQNPKQKYKPTVKMVCSLRDFVKKYKVLFSAVWEDVLGEYSVQDYLCGRIDFCELVSEFYIDKIGDSNYKKLIEVRSLPELDSVVRKNNMFDMND